MRPAYDNVMNVLEEYSGPLFTGHPKMESLLLPLDLVRHFVTYGCTVSR
jgi:hypothetical protein